MARARFCLILASSLALTAAGARAQPAVTPLARLPVEVLDVTPPGERVEGRPGAMSVRRNQSCRSLPLDDVRSRLVHLAVQEWGYFGFPIVEYDEDEDDPPSSGRGRAGGWRRGGGRIGTPEAARTAGVIGGYWAVTPGGAWIVESQNEHWREAISGVTRWRFPWSAAFLSWLMCEGGLGTTAQFERAIAHHSYIDQAIRARDGLASRAAYVAHDPGETVIAEGDLLCTSRRPVFRTLAERRRQMGQGARTHCDLVVKVDEPAGRILAIGGNVRGVVGLKILPAARQRGRFRPVLPARLAAERPMFAHLKLQGEAAPANAFDRSPTLRVLTCSQPIASLATATALRSILPEALACGD